MNGQFWRKAQQHLRAITAFDPGLKVTPVNRSTKTLFGFALQQVTYTPKNRRNEGRKLVDSIVNTVSTTRDVVIFPFQGSNPYTDPTEVALLKSQFPWINQTQTQYILSDLGGGLSSTRTDPTTSTLVWSVEYDCLTKPSYHAAPAAGSGSVPMTRPEILFHELAHIDMEASTTVVVGPPIGPQYKEFVVISRENGFRLSQNPRLTVAQLRSTTNLAIVVVP